MSDHNKKGGNGASPVFRLVKSEPGGARDALLKDLGPTGANPKFSAVQPNAFSPEDEYQQLYVGATRDQGIIQPPYNLRSLDRISQDNNALGPCIEAMVTNIDGTGYEFAADDEEAEDEEDDTNIVALQEFFNEPWPGITWSEMRKLIRRDMERTGNGYIEILRNPQDKIVMIRHVDAKMMRMLRLDDAIPIDVKVIRQGVLQTVTVNLRERRYCQLVNGVSLMYFKEFGSKRDLHKKTAVWSPMGQKLPAHQRATEIMHFTVLPDAHTPYGIPRWVNQIPSVLGSRKAEEFNLDYFDNGGVPPVMVILQGGTLQAETRKAIEQKNSGPATKNNRLQVLEVEPVGGGLDGPVPQARVTVERFGGDRTTDSMFEMYDEKCEKRVRRSFRLPPMFVGAADDYTFATAFASYTVAEAQVFKPERDEFDNIMTMRLLPAMGYDGYKHRSKPLVIEDATLKLQGIEVIQTMADQVEPGDIVEAVNEVAGLHLKVSKNAPDLAAKLQAQQPPPTALNPNATHTMDAQGNVKPINPQPIDPSKGGGIVPGSPKPTGGGPGGVKKPQLKTPLGNKVQQPIGRAVKLDGMNGRELALQALKALRKRDLTELAHTLSIVNSFDTAGRAQFYDFASDLSFLDNTFDPAGLAELSAATMAAIAGQPLQ